MKFTRQIIIHVILLLSGAIIGQQKIFNQNVNELGNFNPHPEQRYSDIWGYTDDSGREYAIMGVFHGTSVIDIMDINNIYEVSFIPGPQSIWRDIKTYNNYAYVVTEAAGENSGLQVIDLRSLPQEAVLVTSDKSVFSTSHNIFIDNGYLYAVGTNTGPGVQILSLTDPAKPDLVGYYGESGYVHDLYVWANKMVVCAGDRYALVNIFDRSKPKLLSETTVIPGIYAHSGWMTEDKKYFIGTDENNSRDITVWEFDGKNDWLLLVDSWQMKSSSTIHNLFIKDKYAHISYYGDGYVVLDISDPEHPLFAGQYDTEPDATNGFTGAWGCYPYLPSGKVLISDINRGLFVLDFISDGTVTSVNESHDVINDHILYQNYPNPFNPKTNISFSLEQHEYVRLEVYNSVGQLVEVLVDRYLEKGFHEIMFDGSELSSGLYISKLSAAGSTFSNKMILLK